MEANDGLIELHVAMNRKLKNIIRGAGSVFEIAPGSDPLPLKESVAERITKHFARVGNAISQASNQVSSEIISEIAKTPRIVAMGVGGAGNTGIDHLLKVGITGVDLIAVNTDAQALNKTNTPDKLLIGRTGLGCGARPECGRESALNSIEKIQYALSGASVLFLFGGMGGGTGTGAMPVVATVAREMGILTIGIVTRPFFFEGEKRMKVAQAGITELSKHVDSLIVMHNDNVMAAMGDDVDVDDCFHAADDVLRNAVLGISDVITHPGLVNVDLEDIRQVFGGAGRAKIGMAKAEGFDRGRIAAERALASPLVEDANMTHPKAMLINVTAAKGNLKMKEINDVMNVVKPIAADDAHIIFGAVYDELMGDALQVTVLTTRFDQQDSNRQTNGPGIAKKS